MLSNDLIKLKKGVFSRFNYTVIHILISLFMIPFVLKFLSKSEYGFFLILTDLIVWLSVSNFGINSAYNSVGAQLIGKKDINEFNNAFNTTFFSQLASAFIILFVGIISSIFTDVIFTRNIDIQNIESIILIMTLSYFIRFSCEPLNSTLIADKQIHIENYLRILSLLIQTTLTIFFLYRGYQLFSLVISNLITTTIMAVISWFRVLKTLPYLKINIRFWNKKHFLHLFKNGIWLTIGGVAGLLIFKADAFLIGNFLSLELVASFVITNKLYQLAQKIHNQIFDVTRPYVAQNFGKGLIKKVKKIYNIIYYSAYSSAFAIGIIIFLINKKFIEIWVGPDFYLGNDINLLLFLNFVIQASVLPNRILLATTFFKIKSHNIVRILEGITKILLCVIFLNKFGLKVIPLSSFICSLLFSIIFLNYISGKFFKNTNSDKYTMLLFLIPVPILYLFFNKVIFSILILFILFLMCYFFLQKIGGIKEIIKTFS